MPSLKNTRTALIRKGASRQAIEWQLSRSLAIAALVVVASSSQLRAATGLDSVRRLIQSPAKGEGLPACVRPRPKLRAG